MEEQTIRIALAGVPNVGKSTVFNALTGMHQHTGNWAGKTVEGAEGTFTSDGVHYILTDLPGTYSLRDGAAEELAAREHLLFAKPDAVIVVCDACCPERSLVLALQAAEICPRVLVCLNLMDEAEQRGIAVDLNALSDMIGLPVVGLRARSGDMKPLLDALAAVLGAEPQNCRPVYYDDEIEARLQILADLLAMQDIPVPPRWAALRLLEQDLQAEEWLHIPEMPPHVALHIAELREHLEQQGWDAERIRGSIAVSVVQTAEDAVSDCIRIPPQSDARDRKLDRIFAGRAGIPVMLLLLVLILWLTTAGANLISDPLSGLLLHMGEILRRLLHSLHAPETFTSLLIDGIWKTTKPDADNDRY